MKLLPKEYLEPLILQVIGGYSCNEIADIMAIKTGAVMTRLTRAKQKMREIIDNKLQIDTSGSNRN